LKNNQSNGFSSEKPFFLPDNEGTDMNTSPVRMDDLPLNGFHCRIAALTFGAHLTDGYVLGVVGYAIIQMTPALQLTPLMAGMVGGSALLGLFLGSLVLGWLSDHIGRQKIFNFSFVVITVASFLQFFVTTPEQLIVLRILIGIGLGGDYSVGHTLLAEFAPRRYRGILLGAFSVVWTVGYVLASLAGHHFIPLSPDAWRWLLASAALPALCITLLRWGTPESPRWLMRQGRFEEAAAATTANDAAGNVGRATEAAKGYFERVEKILVEIEKTYKNQYITSGTLIGEQFFVERRRLFGQLDSVQGNFLAGDRLQLRGQAIDAFGTQLRRWRAGRQHR
jgi:MFS family permease